MPFEWLLVCALGLWAFCWGAETYTQRRRIAELVGKHSSFNWLGLDGLTIAAVAGGLTGTFIAVIELLKATR